MFWKKKLNLATDGDNGVFFTIQGEGSRVGHPTVFIRFAGCNLRCSWKNSDGSITKCDTAHTSWGKDKIVRTVDDIVEQVMGYSCKNITVTGGEPMLQKNIVDLIDKLKEEDKDLHITIETNGTILRDTKADLLSISPKLSTADALGKSNNRKLNTSILRHYTKGYDFQLKFVVNNKEDLKIINRIRWVLNIQPNRVYLMPQGISEEQFKEKEKWVIEQCKKYGFIFCPRVHIMIWGAKKGV